MANNPSNIEPVIPRSGLDGRPLQPPGPYSSEFDKSQYNKAVQDAEILAQTRQDIKNMWAQRAQDKVKDLQNARSIAEAAFDSMVASCLNGGQVQQLMGIKDEWIKDAATGPIQSFSDYMSKWSGRVG